MRLHLTHPDARRVSGLASSRPAGGRRDGRDHHGRQRPLGQAARACRSRPAIVPARGRCGAPSRRRSTSGSDDLVVYAFSTENWSRPQDEVDALMEIFGETIERELPDLAEQGVRVRFIGRRDRAPDELRRRMDAMEDRTELQHPARPLDRVRLRRPRRARRGGAADRRERRRPARDRRERLRGEPLRAGAPGSRPADPDERRAARSRTSCSGSSPTRSSCSSTGSGRTSTRATCASRAGRVRTRRRRFGGR